jgi:hypothetical protein
MGLLCNCPRGAAIGNVPLSDCPENFGQTQKVIFQRIFSAAGTRNKFVLATANPNVIASWTPLLAASDGTKVVQSPYISAPTTEGGDPNEYGGGNDTLGGIPIITSINPTTFKGNILSTSQSTIKALKDFSCENLGVYLIDHYGRMKMLVDDHDTPTEMYPIPITSLVISDTKLGGFAEVDMNMISWRFYPNWSDDTTIVTPTDFNALTDLVTP